MFVPSLGCEQPRQYSLSSVPDGKHLRISVRREHAFIGVPEGLVSHQLHNEFKVGDTIEITPPYGVFTLDTSNPEETAPVLFLAGGIGVTPLMSMLQRVLLEQPKRHVHMVYAARSASVRAFYPLLVQLQSEHSDRMKLTTWLDLPDDDPQTVVGSHDKMAAGQEQNDLHSRTLTSLTLTHAPTQHHPNPHAAATAAEASRYRDPDEGQSTYRGRVDLHMIYPSDSADESTFPPADLQAFICGPIPFMRNITDQLTKLKLSNAQIHSQVFGAELHVKAIGKK
jgi:ferredoxin-NADP reductase